MRARPFDTIAVHDLDVFDSVRAATFSPVLFLGIRVIVDASLQPSVIELRDGYRVVSQTTLQSR